MSTPKRSSRKNKSKKRKEKSQNKSQSRRAIQNKYRTPKSKNKSQKKKKNVTSTRKVIQKSNRNNKKKGSKRTTTPKDLKEVKEKTLITINGVRNSGQLVGIYEVSLKDKEHKKTKYAKEKKLNISNLIQNKRSK